MSASSVEELGNLVRKLKTENAPKEDINNAVSKLKAAKDAVEAANAVVREERKKNAEHRAAVEDIMLRKFFYVPSFEIYGGVAGLYDYGPPGCAVMANLQGLWRKHFILHENMLEVSCSSMTPEIVLKTSGHVERFTDFMVKDVKTGDCYRADKLVEEIMEKYMEVAGDESKTSGMNMEEIKRIHSQAGAMKADQLKVVLDKVKAVAPDTGNPLSDPFAFNLMFQTSIGPTGRFVGYLRPETAQGIFVNFRRLLEYNAGRLPFAGAQIGLAYRNEIAPRAGLLRVREFPLAEIEHFVNPADKRHTNFAYVKDYKLTLLPKQNQTGEDKTESVSCEEAVATGMIDNETLAYFMARTQMFLIQCGAIPQKVRFRQHKDDEMAHYAKDCWDAEIQTTYGWIECVGHADRAAYDLRVHSDKSKVDLSAYEAYDEPKTVEKVVVKVDRGKVGQKFKATAKPLIDHLLALQPQLALSLKDELTKGPALVRMCTGEEYMVDSAMVNISTQQVKESGNRFLPSVIEPSYGLGRIIYSILEHSFYSRSDDRKVLRLAPCIAPVKVAIFNVSGNIPFQPIMTQLVKDFIECNLSTKTDDSKVSIGRKYSRGDEIGIPFAISLDDVTCSEKKLCTIRERDSCDQIQVPLSEVVKLCASMINGSTTWAEAKAIFPAFARNEEDK